MTDLYEINVIQSSLMFDCIPAHRSYSDKTNQLIKPAVSFIFINEIAIFQYGFSQPFGKC